MKEKIKSIIGIGKDFASGMGKRRLTVYATSGCYYLFMSLVPIVMILCCILPYTPFNLATILNYIDEYFAESLGQILRSIANAVYSSNSATLTVSILLTLYSASASMKALMKGMDSAYECENKDNIVIFTLRALFYMVLLVVTLLLSLVIMVYGGKILDLLDHYLIKIAILSALLSKGRYFLVMIILAIVFALLYKLMPSVKVSFKDQLPGAIFSAVTWVIFSAVFTIYIGVSNKFGAYGFIGTIMVAMMWMNYCLLFLLIGGFMNSFLSSRKTTAGYVMAESDSSQREEDYDFLDDPLLSLDEENEADTRALDDSSDNGLSDSEDSACDPSSENPDADQTGLTAEKSESDENEDGSKEKTKKKIPIPLIAAAAACAVSAILAIFFIFRKKKKGSKKKASASNNQAQ